jgi:hypothetical protein
MRLTRVVCLSAVFAAAVSVAACDINAGEGHGFSLDFAAGKAQDTWTRTYTLPAGGRVELVNVNGAIEAEPSSGAAIEVTGVRTAKAMTDERAKELLEKVEIREEVSEGRVRVEVRAPRMSGMSGHDVKWTVKVPQGIHVDFRTTNGGVRLQGLKGGEIHAETVNGGVTGTRLATATIDASAVNGGVRMELESALPADGRIKLETVNGGVTLQLPETSRATIAARTVNGGVEVTELDVVLQGEKNRRRLDATLNGGGARVNLDTTNGGVKLSRTSTRPTS